MKRYLIFAALSPLIDGFILLFVTTYQSGYWTHTDLSEVTKLFVVFAKTLQYSYLFGLLPTLMMAAVDDILWHVKRIRPVGRMMLVGVLSFLAAVLRFGSPGPDTGVCSSSSTAWSASSPPWFAHGWRMRRSMSRRRRR